MRIATNMKMKKVGLLCISLVLCLALAACKGKVGEEEATISPPGEGDMAVEITVNDLEGKKVSLSQFKGKAIMLNFWATWCPPCREEMPSMEAMYQKLKGSSDFVMLAISIDENMEAVKEFVKKNNYKMPVFHDPNREAGSVYGLTGVPETFLIDKKGKIVMKRLGPEDWMKPEVIDTVQGLMK